MRKKKRREIKNIDSVRMAVTPGKKTNKQNKNKRTIKLRIYIIAEVSYPTADD